VPPSMKLAPEWNVRLSELAPRISAELARRGSWQGSQHLPEAATRHQDKV